MKSFLKKLLIITLELAIIAGLLLYIAEKKGIKNISQVVPAIEKTVEDVQNKVKPFPELLGETKKIFDWEYRGQKYKLEFVMHQSVYEYYNKQPKAYSYVGQEPPLGWEEEYYAMFTKGNASDNSIQSLARGLEELGKTRKLSEDQMVDLVLAFVQSIPYDELKAKNILTSGGDEKMLYPYELLWEQKGVCSDKSILAYVILKEMGYGTALFTYKESNHMAVAVQCPESYSTYRSGYCYAETTSSGNKIGIIPSIDAENSKAVNLSSYDLSQAQNINLKELGQIEINLKTQGKEYGGIIETEKLAEEMESLKKNMEALLLELKSLKKSISEEEGKLEDLEKDLEEYKDEKEYEKYNETVKKFNSLLEAYKKDVKKYNNGVVVYNQYAERYNVLIKQ